MDQSSEDLSLRVYISSAVNPFSETTLEELLKVSISNNRKVGITGVLLYADGCILQAFEGPSAEVEKLFNRIHRDSRHRGIISLLKKPIKVRLFPDWSMGFRLAEFRSLGSLEGMNDFLETGKLSSPISESAVLTLLTQFKTSSQPFAA